MTCAHCESARKPVNGVAPVVACRTWSMQDPRPLLEDYELQVTGADVYEGWADLGARPGDINGSGLLTNGCVLVESHGRCRLFKENV